MLQGFLLWRMSVVCPKPFTYFQLQSYLRAAFYSRHPDRWLVVLTRRTLDTACTWYSGIWGSVDTACTWYSGHMRLCWHCLYLIQWYMRLCWHCLYLWQWSHEALLTLPVPDTVVTWGTFDTACTWYSGHMRLCWHCLYLIQWYMRLC
jgi:hypothetical protein